MSFMRPKRITFQSGSLMEGVSFHRHRHIEMQDGRMVQATMKETDEARNRRRERIIVQEKGVRVVVHRLVEVKVDSGIIGPCRAQYCSRK